MKIITFNFKNTRDIIINKVLKNRIAKVVEIYNKNLPDVIGMQEITNKELRIFKKELINYNIIGESRHSFGLSDEYNPLFLNKNIKIIKNKTYSLSENIEKLGQKLLNAKYPRICTTAHIIYNNERYLIINTHLDHQYDEIREKELDILTKIIKSELNKNENLIVFGDFNMNRCEMIDKFSENNNLYITNNLGNTYKNKAIDYIFVSKSLKVNKAIKLEKEYDDVIISDHNPVLVEIK